MLSSATDLWKLFRDQAERDSGIGLKLFGFTAESVFTIIPESCSRSSWISVRNHPGIALTFDRIPHPGTQDLPNKILKNSLIKRQCVLAIKFAIRDLVAQTFQSGHNTPAAVVYGKNRINRPV